MLYHSGTDINLVIVAMSALFERHSHTKMAPIELNRTLELRQIPRLQLVDFDYPPSINLYSRLGDPVNASVSQIFNTLSTNWIYSAISALTLSGADPAWSSDGWGFVPIIIPDLQQYIKKQNIGSYNTTQGFLGISSADITVSTSAIRGRAECSYIAGLDNHSRWLEPDPIDPQSGKAMALHLKLFPGNENHTTTIAPSGYYFECCTNHSSTPQIQLVNSTATSPTSNSSWTIIEKLITPMAVGYWTKNIDKDMFYGFAPKAISAGNFTPKWIAGKGGFKARRVDYGSPPDLLFFTDEVEMQALNCMPIIETSEAEVTVNSKTGKVHTFKILNEPTIIEEPWSDPFLVRNRSHPSDPIEYTGQNLTACQNMTTR
jgi:hypothetical protein